MVAVARSTGSVSTLCWSMTESHACTRGTTHDDGGEGKGGWGGGGEGEGGEGSGGGGEGSGGGGEGGRGGGEDSESGGGGGEGSGGGSKGSRGVRLGSGVGDVGGEGEAISLGCKEVATISALCIDTPAKPPRRMPMPETKAMQRKSTHNRDQLQ